jgi:hypothetical protein
VVKAFVTLKSGYTGDDELRRDLMGQARKRPGRRWRPRRSTSSTRCRTPAPARSCAGCSRRVSSGARGRHLDGGEPGRGEVVTDAALARALLTDMIRVRRMEEKCAEMYSAGKIRGFLHLYVGEEAVAAGSLRVLGRRTR